MPLEYLTKGSCIGGVNIVVAMVTIRLFHDRIRIKKREYSCYFGSDIRIDLPIFLGPVTQAQCTLTNLLWKGLEKGSRSNGILF